MAEINCYNNGNSTSTCMPCNNQENGGDGTFTSYNSETARLGCEHGAAFESSPNTFMPKKHRANLTRIRNPRRNMTQRQNFYNTNGDTIEYQPNSNKPVNSTNEYANEPQNWNQSHIDGIIDYMINDMYYGGHLGYKCQGVTGPIPNYVFQAIQQYPNAGGDLSPFLLSNGSLHPLAQDQIQSNILNLCESGGVPDTHQALACTLCPVETIYDGVDIKGNPIMVQGCEYFTNTNYIARVKENGTWYNLGIPSIYHNMPMYPGGCPTTGYNQNNISVTTNAPSSSGGTSPTGGGISLQQARPTRPKKKRKEMERAKKLKASGCGCGSNFSGDRKPCTCGRNPGGDCQCNNSNASGRRQTSEPKKYDMLKFNNYVSKIKTKKQMNFVNPTKYGAGEDDVFAFNPRVVEQFSTNSKGFLDKADLDNYSF